MLWNFIKRYYECVLIKLREPSKNRLVRYFMLLMLVCTLFTGCSKDKKEDLIQSVVMQVFSCPNEELIKLMNDMNEEIEISNTNKKSTSLEDFEFFKKLDSIYSPYFTDKCYEDFLNKRIPYKYHIETDSLGYKMNVTDIEIKQSKNTPTNFDFSINLSYGPEDGEKIKTSINGSAQFADGNDKISFIRFFDDDLNRELEESH